MDAKPRAVKVTRRFERAMDRQIRRNAAAILGRLARARVDYERMIHSELRLLRQRASLAHAVEQVSRARRRSSRMSIG